MPHPALSKVTAAYKDTTTAHTALFEARGLLEEAVEVIPEDDPALESTQQALTQIRQILDTTLPLVETIRQVYKLVQEKK